MKKAIITTCAIAILGPLSAQTQWGIDASHSSVKFSITHMMVSEVEGNFKKFTGSMTADKTDFSDAVIKFSIVTSSINTDNEDRDKHLQGADFFESEKYPEITFNSTSLKKGKDNTYKLTGDLTLHGVTKSVSWDLVYKGTIKDNKGNTKAGFKATLQIKRSDFDLKWNKTLDAGGLVLSDEVNITANMEVNKK